MHKVQDAGDHASAVLAFLAAEQAAGRRAALAVVVGVEGTASRPVGALMGVGETDGVVGYVSNGCIDADVAIQARASISDAAARRLRYGLGSPFKDLRLPCGGGIDVFVLPNPDENAVRVAADGLRRRLAVQLTIDANGWLIARAIDDRRGAPIGADAAFAATYAPPLRIAVAGRGAEARAFIRLTAAAQYGVTAFSPDPDVLALANAAGGEGRAIAADAPAPWPDDPWTAIALFFHEHEWETALLASALETRAFFIGAMGSRAAHAARCEALGAEGFDEAAIARIAPRFGLIPSARDATTMAVSALAQIVDQYRLATIA